MSGNLYETDFYAWAIEQAALLRAGKLTTADIENIAEEIESMGRTEKRELVNHLAVLLLHLLKWRYQPQLQGASWRKTIHIQRLEIIDHLTDNPSLKPRFPEVIERAYRKAVDAVELETGFPEGTFPAICPWPFDQMMARDFWPESR